MDRIQILFQLTNAVIVYLYTIICRRVKGFLCASPLEQYSTEYLAHILRMVTAVSDFDLLRMLKGK